MTWQRFPLLRIFVGFALGIAWVYHFSPPYSILLVPLIPAVLLFTASLTPLASSQKILRFRSLRGLSLLFFTVILGMLATYRFQYRTLPQPKEKPGSYLIQITAAPQEKPRSIAIQGKLIRALTDSLPQKAAGGTMLYLQKDTAAQALQYGDYIAVEAHLKTPDPPANPEQFDYPAYLAQKGIYYTAYADSNHWVSAQKRAGFTIKRWAIDARINLLQKIKNWPLAPPEKSVAEALLLGYRDDISPELREKYAGAGASHVLAVSGLHVGILYLVASQLLFFLKKIRYGDSLKMGVLILILWSYAFLTGLSPSVVRAATMFTFVALGTTFGRITSIYNTLLASALILLAIRPTYLYSVGFQLSYMAVFSIVWLQPVLASLWQPRYFLGRKFWDITTVSIAAQIGTFPLAIYYFHQFPGLFLIANWIILPLIPAIMYWGGSCLILDSFNVLPTIAVKVLSWGLQGMNFTVKVIEASEFWLINQLHLHLWEMVAIYLTMGFFILWLLFGKYQRLQISLGILAILVFAQIWENETLHKQQQLVIYNMPEHSVIGFYQKNKALWLSNAPSAKAIEANWQYNVAPQAIRLNIIDTSWMLASPSLGGAHLQWPNAHLWVYQSSQSPPTCKWWYVEKCLKPPQNQVKKLPEMVVLNCPYTSTSKKWQEWTAKNKVKFFNMENPKKAFTAAWH